MTFFWITAGAMALVVAALLGLALVRGQREVGPAQASDIQVYRDQLQEIERDLARGVIPAEEADRLRTEVSRRLLTADAQARSATAGRGEQPAVATLAVAGVSALAIVGGAFFVYTRIGAPGYDDLPLAQRIAQAEEARVNRPSQAEIEATVPASIDPDVSEEYMNNVERLRGIAAERSADLEALQFLARAEAQIGNYKGAYEAYERVLSVKGDAATSGDYTALAYTMILAAGGYVSPEAQAALEAALRRDPENGMARYFAGELMAQIGRPDYAFRMWDRLLRESTADAPWVPPIRAQIGDMAWLAGKADYEMPELASAPLRGPTAEDMDNAAQLSPEAQADMIRGMVDGLSERLSSDGGTAEEWARLVNALGVLGDTDRAGQIWSEAQMVFAEAPEALDLIREAAQRAGVAE